MKKLNIDADFILKKHGELNCFYIEEIVDDTPVFTDKPFESLIDLFFFYYRVECLGLIKMYCSSYSFIKDYVVYDTYKGIFTNNPVSVTRKGHSDYYPYSLFSKNYSVGSSLDLFKGREYKYLTRIPSKIKHSIGIEYESESGYIPEYYCLKYGLVPLRDGSISGTEYATIPINPDFIESSINTHTSLMSKYCTFNKECSTHIHFGNINVNPTTIYCIYVLLHKLQNDFEYYLGDSIFHTSDYKDTDKDYCKKLDKFNSFDDLFRYLSMGSSFLGSMYEEHPESIGRRSKWNIKSRYHWVNLVNACFYQKGKTVEFRFLPATNNKEFISNWVLILDTLISYAEDVAKTLNNTCGIDLYYDDIAKLYPKTIRGVLYRSLDKGLHKDLSMFLCQIKDLYSVEEGGINKVLLHPEYVNSMKYNEIIPKFRL